MPGADRLYALVAPLNQACAGWITGSLSIPVPVGMIMSLLRLLEIAVAVLLICRLGAALQDRTREHRARLAFTLPRNLAAAVAVAIFAWSLYAATGNYFSLFLRWDHFVFCAASGYALSGLPLGWRCYVLGALSGYFLTAHFGIAPMAILVAAGLTAFAMLGATPRVGPTVGLQAAVMLATFAAIWALGARNALAGLGAQGLFAFALLRHISFVVETRRGRAAAFTDYVGYMLFYPAFVGTVEVYDEFHDRNLRAAGSIDYGTAAAKIVRGSVLLWVALWLGVSFQEAIALRDPLRLWGHLVLLFITSALYAMGLWSTIEGIAHLYGIELRPNFPNVLTCRNPAEFWRAWRATMTNWLIRYVYIPLGGNRHDQVRNICAAFAVSVLWHWMGVPFLARHPAGRDFVPIGLWGIINAAGVGGYFVWHRHRPAILPHATPPSVRIACTIALTWIFATCTVTLLTFKQDSMDRFLPFLRMLVGLR